MSNSLGDNYLEVRRLFYQYENQRIISVVLKAYIDDGLKNEYKGKTIKIWLEPEIEPTAKKTESQIKTPDMLLTINYEEWLILDYKQIESSNKDTILSHVTDVSKYNQEFIFSHGTIKRKFNEKFTPRIGIICPSEILGSVPSIGEVPTNFSLIISKLGGKIRLNPAIDNLSRGFKSLFKDQIVLPHTDKLAVIKFLKHDPTSLSYTSQILTDVLPSLGKIAGSKTIDTNLEELANRLTIFYPPYLRNKEGVDLNQITRGRVTKAIKFLARIGFVELTPRGKITMKRSKGRRIDDILEYLLQEESKIYTKQNVMNQPGTLDSWLQNGKSTAD